MPNYKVVDADKLDADLTTVADAIREKTGKEDKLTLEQMAEEIGSIEAGGEELFFSGSGAGYTKNMVITATKIAVAVPSLYQNAVELESVSAPNMVSTSAGNLAIFNSSTFAFSTKLKKAYLPKVQYAGHYVFRNCTALEEVQIGSIGYPLIFLGDYCFMGCAQSNLTITVYVADDATLPFTKSPWGATNATIIYRSATTGEVIEV